MENNTCYLLDDKRKRDFGDYYWFSKAFDEKEVQRLEKQVEEENIKVDYGKIFASDKLKEVESYRKSKVGWIPQNKKFSWVYEKIEKMIREANGKMWHFDLVGMSEQAQFGVYDGDEKGHYDWHMDLGNEGVPARRKLSAVLQLSDPESYDGGELKVKVKRDEITIWKKKGGMCVFPSFYMHKVTPVTKGIRKSLVLWNSGLPFK